MMTLIRTFTRTIFNPSALALGIAALLILLLPVPGLAAPTERIIHLRASDFAFTPEVVRVNPGDRVTITLESTDVAHGLTIDGYALDLHAEPGQPATGSFTAGRAGTFKLRCSIACGSLHPFMTGKFQVGPNLLLLRAAGLAGLVLVAGALKLRKPEDAKHG